MDENKILMPEEKRNSKKRYVYDDTTIANMMRYYNLESHDELLKYIKIHGLKQAE